MSLLARFQRPRPTPERSSRTQTTYPAVAVPVTPAPVDELLHTWKTRVAAWGGALPGSAVIDLNRDPHVATLRVRLNGVTDYYPAVLPQARRIAAALGRPAEQVTIEASDTQRGDEIRVLVVDERSPIYAVGRPPTNLPVEAHDGRIRIGAFTDQATATWELFNDRGAVHGAVFGDPDTGRTGLLRTILAAADAHPLVDIHAIDPFGELLHGPSTGHAVLNELCALAEQRRRRLAAEQTGAWNPHRERLQLLVVDGLAAISGDRNLHALARIGRKVGIAIVAAADNATHAAFSDNVTRQELTRTNVALLRTTDNITRQLSGAQGLMTDLPRRWHTGTDTYGVGYLPRQRNALFRADLV